jgi:hypothetical protein
MKRSPLSLGILSRMGLRHAAVGSIASSIHGLPRFTDDADILVEIGVGDVESLAKLAEGIFYLDASEAVKSVLAGRAST